LRRSHKRFELLNVLANREKLIDNAGNLALRDIVFTMKLAT
jgi:hypothetical protein